MNKIKQIKKGASKESPTKILKNNLRERKRYILIKMIPFLGNLPNRAVFGNLSVSSKITDAVSKTIINTAKSVLGIILSSRAGVRIMKNLSKKGYIVIQCNRNYINEIKLSLSLVTDAGLSDQSFKIILSPVLVSGSLHKIKETIKEYLSGQEKY